MPIPLVIFVGLALPALLVAFSALAASKDGRANQILAFTAILLGLSAFAGMVWARSVTPPAHFRAQLDRLHIAEVRALSELGHYSADPEELVRIENTLDPDLFDRVDVQITEGGYCYELRFADRATEHFCSPPSWHISR